MNEQHFEESNNKEKLAKKKKRKKTNQKKNHSSQSCYDDGSYPEKPQSGCKCGVKCYNVTIGVYGDRLIFWKQAQVATRGSAGFFFFASFFINE